MDFLILGMCCCEGYGCQAVQSSIRYKNQRVYILGLEKGIIFQETDQLVENFSLTWGNKELTLKSAHSNYLRLNLIVKISSINLSSFWKIGTPGKGGILAV